MLIFFITFLSSCLFKDNKASFKEEVILGKPIEGKLKLKTNLDENIKIFLKNEKYLIEGIKRENFYEFLIQKEGFYKIVVDSESYTIDDIRISIFKSGNSFYYKGAEEIILNKVFENEPIKISSEQNENTIQEVVTKLINLDIKTNIEVNNESFNKPSLVNLKPLYNNKVSESFIENSKFNNNDVGDYFEMPLETIKREKLFGESLKDSLSNNKGLISTLSNIFSDIFFNPSEIKEEESRKEAYNMKLEEIKNSKTSDQISSYTDYKPAPAEIETIKLRKQKENFDKVKVQQRVLKTVNDTLKDIPESKDNSVPEILNKFYEIFKK